MGFDYLLKHAVIPGVTSCGEKGKGAFLKPEGDETIIVFHLDNPRVRRRFKLTESPCCDNLFFYKHNCEPGFLAFVELKGKHKAREAGEQILSAYNAICPEGCELRKEAKGLIVLSGGAPTNHKEVLRKLAEAGIISFFGRSDKNNKCDIRELQGLKAYFQSSDRKKSR